MIPIRANPISSLFGWRSSSLNTAGLPKVKIHDIETSTDGRARRLKHLVKANHANHAIIHEETTCYNQMTHVSELPIFSMSSAGSNPIHSCWGPRIYLAHLPILWLTSMMPSPSLFRPGQTPPVRYRCTTGETTLASPSEPLRLELYPLASVANDVGRYQRAFIDFFEDQLVRFAYDWEDMLKHFLFDVPEPLVEAVGHSCELYPPGPNYPETEEF
jgi:hypothetical protein